MRSNVLTVVLAAMTVVLVGAVMNGTRLPFITGDREAVIALAAVGFLMCATGPLGDVAKDSSWLSWSGILGALLGTVAMVIAGGTILGIQLPFVTTERGAFIALAVVVFAKLGIGILHRTAGRPAQSSRPALS